MKSKKARLEGLIEPINNWIEVRFLEMRHDLVSGSLYSKGVGCYIASAHPNGGAAPSNLIEAGLIGHSDLSARLAALRLWVRKHGAKPGSVHPTSTHK